MHNFFVIQHLYGTVAFYFDEVLHVWFDLKIEHLCRMRLHLLGQNSPSLITRWMLQGLCEQAMEVFKSMEKDGVELNLSMLNLLINAFGVAGRHIEAFSVFDYILEVVRSHSKWCMTTVE